MSDLVENERTKLLAGALDRASTACFTVGVLAPTAAALYGAGTFGLEPLAAAAICARLDFGRRSTTLVGKSHSRSASIMTSFQIFAFFGLPIIVVAIGAGAAYLHLRDLRRRHPTDK